MNSRPSPGTLIGRGRVADVHAHGDHALKLSHAGRSKTDAFNEAAILAALEPHRLPAPRVHEAGSYFGRWGLVVDRVDGEALGEQLQRGAVSAPACIEEMVRLQLLLHAAAEPRLHRLKVRLADKIGQAPGFDEALRATLLDRLAALPDDNRICHGDFHPLNILGEPGRGVIVDWPDATCGPPAADACRSYLLLVLAAPLLAEDYLVRYAAASGIGRDAILAWLPCLAAARLTEGVEAEAAQLLELARGG